MPSFSVAMDYPCIKKFDWNGTQISYSGFNLNFAAQDSDDNWIISIYTYDGSGNTSSIRAVKGSWTNRASL